MQVMDTPNVNDVDILDNYGFIRTSGYLPGSNDVYVSTPHKVVSPKNADRYSVAFFLDPNPDAMVACLPTCTSAERPAKYPPVTGAEFLRSRLEPTYAKAAAP